MEDIDKQEFEGELRHIDPCRLIKEESDPLDGFFLVLAVIYNDLKDLVLFSKMLQDQYKIPVGGGPSVHAGECGGIINHITKLLMSHSHEFFKFLKENEQILLSSEFKNILNETNKTVIGEWDEIVNIAMGRETKQTKFAKILEQVRHNISSHYHQSGEVLRKSFRDYFFIRDKIERNDLAYYSLGDSMSTTRFFYADAAVEEYIRAKIIGPPIKGHSNPVPSDLDLSEIRENIAKMNFTISRILKAYLRDRPK